MLEHLHVFVTRSSPSPAFHHPGHLRMWETSPLRGFDPHLFLIVMGIILIGGISFWLYFRNKNQVSEMAEGNEDEEAFQVLILKRDTIMKKIVEIEKLYQSDKINQSEYEKRIKSYKEYLIKVKLQLREFTE